MSGLSGKAAAFMSKKSWNPRNWENREKVWLAEQQAKKEMEVTQQLKEEREQEYELELLKKRRLEVMGKEEDRYDNCAMITIENMLLVLFLKRKMLGPLKPRLVMKF